MNSAKKRAAASTPKVRDDELGQRLQRLRLERGLVARRPSVDGRRQLAELTDAGAAQLAAISPGHLAEVRRVVFDHLERREVAVLGAIMQRIGDAATTALG